MASLTKASDIWKTQPTPNDKKSALDYATISLPWTFDRMRYGGRTQNATNKRLVKILEGVLNQTILQRRLKKDGTVCKMDWTGYRESDIFDFIINKKKFDVKTGTIYSNYDKKFKRTPFSPQLVIKHKNNFGPEYKNFFPVGVAISQINPKVKKDSYIFGFTVTAYDPRTKDGRKPKQGDGGFWCSAPFLQPGVFFHSTKVIFAREEEKKGFFIRINWKREQSTLDAKKITVKFFGEWNAKRLTKTIKLSPRTKTSIPCEFSSLSTINVDHPSLLLDGDKLEITVQNNFKKKIPKSTNPNINLNDSRFTWTLTNESFINLNVIDYAVYWLGHISFDKFCKTFVKYPSYFIPLPGRKKNQPAEPTSRLKTKFQNFDKYRNLAVADGEEIPWPEFMPLIKRNKMNFGLLVSAQGQFQALGPASYIYPQGYGFQESAFYVLPKDLDTMSSL